MIKTFCQYPHVKNNYDNYRFWMVGKPKAIILKSRYLSTPLLEITT